MTAFQLKGSIITVSVLQLLNLDYSTLENQLLELTKKTPQFFEHMPVIIDLQKIPSHSSINYSEVSALLKAKGLIPVGVINANEKQTKAAIDAGLGILPDTKTHDIPKITNKIETAKIITQPVRSGQQIYAKDSDLIILSSVSNGAEILADGNIHVYGNLRGRAIAGASGEPKARIFCQHLEAELIAIAGHYKLQEEIDVNHTEPVQIFLDNDQLRIANLYS